MDYTKNYHLPQWVATDRIMRKDFNQMCTDIESGLTRAQEKADAAAELPYVVGHYAGNGADSQDITVGFRPSFVIVCGNQKTFGTMYTAHTILLAGPIITSELLYMTDTGFRVVGGDNFSGVPAVNSRNLTYDFIAFR